MKSLWNKALTAWQPASAWLVALLLIALLFGFRAGSLVQGISEPELNIRASTMNFRSIVDNPVNAPYKIAQYSVGKISRNISTQRLVSGLAAGLMIILFYTIASRIFSRYAAFSGTLMFATSSSLLHSGRLGTTTIMLLSIFALIVCGYAARFSPRNSRWLLVTSAAIGLSLYTPGMLYFILIGAIWQFKAIKKSLRSASPWLIAACVMIALASMAPIVMSLMRDSSLMNIYLGIPDPLPSVRVMLTTAVSVPLGIFITAPANPLYRLGHQPMLDIFSAGMFIIGCYALLQRRVLDRTWLLLGVLIICIVWSGVSGTFENSLVMLPFIFLVVSTGITWLLKQWLVVFPSNPLARSVAYVLIAIGVLFSCNFQLQRYFLAWPNTPETKTVFTQR